MWIFLQRWIVFVYPCFLPHTFIVFHRVCVSLFPATLLHCVSVSLFNTILFSSASLCLCILVFFHTPLMLHCVCLSLFLPHTSVVFHCVCVSLQLPKTSELLRYFWVYMFPSIIFCFVVLSSVSMFPSTHLYSIALCLCIYVSFHTLLVQKCTHSFMCVKTFVFVMATRNQCINIFFHAFKNSIHFVP